MMFADYQGSDKRIHGKPQIKKRDGLFCRLQRFFVSCKEARSVFLFAAVRR